MRVWRRWQEAASTATSRLPLAPALRYSFRANCPGLMEQQAQLDVRDREPHRPALVMPAKPGDPVRLRACLKTGRGPAVRDFGVGQGGKTGASLQRAVTAEPTQANAKRPRRPEGFRGKGHLTPLLLSQRPLRVSSFVAPCHLAFPAKTGPLPIFRQALNIFTGRFRFHHSRSTLTLS